MKRLLIIGSALLALAQAAPAAAQQPGDDPFGKYLFAPELVVQHQSDIGLRPEQRTAITKAIGELQARALDVQWRMQDAAKQVVALLDRTSIDQAATLAKVDEILGMEREIKRAQLTLLIQIKNTLTPEQQAKLEQYRKK